MPYHFEIQTVLENTYHEGQLQNSQKVRSESRRRQTGGCAGPPEAARFALDTLSIHDVGTAYRQWPCKDAAKYLCYSRWSWSWAMAVLGAPRCAPRYHADRRTGVTLTSAAAG